MSNAVRTRLFTADGEQAVRIPDEFAFADPSSEVIVSRSGDVVTIQPLRTRISLRDAIEQLRSMPTPSEVEQRAPVELPDRRSD